jgi:hypothetical protein
MLGIQNRLAVARLRAVRSRTMRLGKGGFFDAAGLDRVKQST